MIRFFRMLRALISNPWAWRKCDDWTNEDSTALSAFLSTRAGLKLAYVLRNASVEANANAVANSSVHLNGTASGLMLAIRYIESLSRPVPAQWDETTEGDGSKASDILEHLRP